MLWEDLLIHISPYNSSKENRLGELEGKPRTAENITTGHDHSPLTSLPFPIILDKSRSRPSGRVQNLHSMIHSAVATKRS